MRHATNQRLRTGTLTEDRWWQRTGRVGGALFLALFLLPLMVDERGVLQPVVAAVQVLLAVVAVWVIAGAIAGSSKQWFAAPASERLAFVRSRNAFRLQRAVRRR